MEGRIIGEVVVVPVANPIGLSQHFNGRLLGRFDSEGTGNFNRGFPDLTPAALERLQGRLNADPAANVALIRQTLRSVLAEQPAVRETEALKRALLSQAIDADWVLDPVIAIVKRCCIYTLRSGSGRRLWHWARNWARRWCCWNRNRAAIPSMKPAPVPGGNCGRCWQWRGRCPLACFADHGGTARSGRCE